MGAVDITFRPFGVGPRGSRHPIEIMPIPKRVSVREYIIKYQQRIQVAYIKGAPPIVSVGPVNRGSERGLFAVAPVQCKRCSEVQFRREGDGVFAEAISRFSFFLLFLPFSSSSMGLVIFCPKKRRLYNPVSSSLIVAAVGRFTTANTTPLRLDPIPVVTSLLVLSEYDRLRPKRSHSLTWLSTLLRKLNRRKKAELSTPLSSRYPPDTK